MQSECHLVEIALDLDAGLIDEPLIRSKVRVLIKMGGSAERAEIEINDAIGLRQQAGRFRGCLLAQVDGSGQQQQNHDNDRDSDPGASVHFVGGRLRPLCLVFSFPRINVYVGWFAWAGALGRSRPQVLDPGKPEGR